MLILFTYFCCACRNNRDEAHTILHEELSTFLLYNPNLIERGTEIMNLENFRYKNRSLLFVPSQLII